MNPRKLQSLIFLTAMAGVVAFILSSDSSSADAKRHRTGYASLPACWPPNDVSRGATEGGTLEAMRIQVDNCVACHGSGPDGVVTLFKTSIHARNRKTCTSCHGGDASAPDKARAHSQRFVGQPSSNEVLSMCGACHTNQLSVLKTSRHFPERPGSPRVGCVQCHGAHTVGSPSRNFSFAYYCAGCHGLEYLPHLPAELRKTLSMRDEVSDSLRSIESSRGTLSSEARMAEKEISRKIGEIVHATDSEGAIKKALTIQEQITSLRKFLESKK